MITEILTESMTIRVSPKEKRRIYNFAKKNDISFSEAIRTLCRLCLDQIEKTEEANEN